ncbi:hypothetical protein, conserved [Eimeria praecox]|uniref:Uncharacterized protein n=1 Tax=Eimeria praecox TaxID=51316 RepID=U6G3P3_9EIME|nr:hypothetical protein, conserved [Eimeria praecox]
MAIPGTIREARCPLSISIEPPSPHSSATVSPRCGYGAAADQSSTLKRHNGDTNFSSGSDADVDASVLCPHYDEHHKGMHYKQYLKQKAAEANIVKQTSRPPLWRVPIVRQPLPALWSHARSTVEDKEAAQDFAQSPMGQDTVPQRCPELDEAGWRRRELVQHSWEDRPGAVGRPLSPTIIRQGPSWLVDAEGYEGPFGSPGDLRSKGMAYNSRFQLPTLSSLMKAKHAVFVKAKDPREARIASERQRPSKRRGRQPQRLGGGRCRSSPPQVKTPTDFSESLPQQQQPQQLLPAALSPSHLKPPDSPLSPNASVGSGLNGSPRGSLPRSPKTSAPPSPAGSPKNKTVEIRSPRSPVNEQQKGQSAGESWTVQIRGKGKYQYPESYIRWKRERRRMRERLKRLRAGEIFTSDRPKESCTDCESPSLCWDPQPLTEHLHAVRSFGSAPEDDASSGTDLSSSSQRSSSISTSNSDSSSRSCSPYRKANGPQKYSLRTPACGNSFAPSPFTVANSPFVPPSALYPFAGAATGVTFGGCVYAPSGLPYTPVLPGVALPLQRSSCPGKNLCLGNSMQQVLVPRPNTAGSTLTYAPTSFVPSLQQQPTLLGQQQVPRSYVAVQLPRTGATHQAIVVQPPHYATVDQPQQPQKQQQPLQYEVLEEAQKPEQQKGSTKVENNREKEHLHSKPWDGAANSQAPREERGQKDARFSQSKQRNSSGNPHVRYASAPPPAGRHTGKAAREEFLPSSGSTPPDTLSPVASPVNGGGRELTQQALPQAVLQQPIVIGPSHQVFGSPQLFAADPRLFQSAPQLVHLPHNALQGTPQAVQGVPVAAIPHGQPLVVSAGTQLVSKTPQQIHPGGHWVFSEAERLPRQQPAANASASHRSASCGPAGSSLVVAPLPLLPQQQTPIVVRNLRHQPLLVQQPQQQATFIHQQHQPLLIQKQWQPLVVQRQQQQPLLINQQQQQLVVQQQPLVIQHMQPVTVQQKQQLPQQSAGRLVQQQPNATIVIQQGQPAFMAQHRPATVVQQPTINTPNEQKPAAPSKPKEKPKTQWLWSCNIDCGARCGGSPAGNRGQQQEQQKAQPKGEHQPAQRLQRTQEAQRTSPKGAFAEVPVPSRLAPTAAAVPVAESKGATAQQARHHSQQPCGSSGTSEATQGSPQTSKHLQPPQQKLEPVAPRQQQPMQPQQKLLTPTAPSPSSPITLAPAAPPTQHIFSPSAPALCTQAQQLQQQPPQAYRRSPCCQPNRGGDTAQHEPPFKYLPFTFISPKRNIACGVGKREAATAFLATAAHPAAN